LYAQPPPAVSQPAIQTDAAFEGQDEPACSIDHSIAYALTGGGSLPRFVVPVAASRVPREAVVGNS
jgi:hypothetical protein